MRDISWDRVPSVEFDEIDEDIEFLEVWLTEHILTEDMRLGAYLSQAS